MQLTECAYRLLVGSLFGSGRIVNREGRKPYYIERKSCPDNRRYLEWKAERMGFSFKERSNYSNRKQYSVMEIISRSLPDEFSAFRHDGEWASRMGDEGLMVWFMDTAVVTENIVFLISTGEMQDDVPDAISAITGIPMCITNPPHSTERIILSVKDPVRFLLWLQDVHEKYNMPDFMKDKIGLYRNTYYKKEK